MIKGFTKANFKKWLESKHPRTKVGAQCACTGCPLAKFVVQTLPVKGKYVEVDGDALSIYDSEKSKVYPLPQWANDFIGLVDGDDPWADSSVSASKALSILRKCA